MEYDHTYIQWLFPLRLPSNFNPDAPLLTDEDVKLFHSSTNLQENFRTAVHKFLRFMGLECTENGFEPASNYSLQAYTWLEFNHNALRITRFLTCLSIMGECDFAEQLLRYMKEAAEIEGAALNPNTLAYWEDALKGDKRELV